MAFSSVGIGFEPYLGLKFEICFQSTGLDVRFSYSVAQFYTWTSFWKSAWRLESLFSAMKSSSKMQFDDASCFIEDDLNFNSSHAATHLLMCMKIFLMIDASWRAYGLRILAGIPPDHWVCKYFSQSIFSIAFRSIAFVAVRILHFSHMRLYVNIFRILFAAAEKNVFYWPPIRLLYLHFHFV